MKRYFGLVLCFLFLIIFLRAMTIPILPYKGAFAQTGEIGIAGDGLKTVSIPAEIVADPCKQLTIPIEIDEVEGIAGMDLDLRFDPETIIPVDVERTTLTDDFLHMFRDSGDGLLRISIAYHTGMSSGSGAIINLIFDIFPDAILSSELTEISIERARLYNENADLMEMIIHENGQILMQDIRMNLPKGWSIISLSVIPDDPKASALFPDAVVIYKYERDSGYVHMEGTESLEIGRGYWIKLNEGQDNPSTGQPIQSYNISLYEDGWSMIGGCTCPARAQLDNGKIIVIYQYVQGFGYQRIPASGLIEPGKGYWILCQDIMGEAELEVKWDL
jgi:hypothetical protein